MTANISAIITLNDLNIRKNLCPYVLYFTYMCVVFTNIINIKKHFVSFRILRQPYCKTYPGDCSFQRNTWESFCNEYGRMCPQTKPLDFNFGVSFISFITLDHE